MISSILHYSIYATSWPDSRKEVRANTPKAHGLIAPVSTEGVEQEMVDKKNSGTEERNVLEFFPR